MFVEETDREYLIGLHNRLTKHYGESPLLGYLHRLRAIILNTPNDRISSASEYTTHSIEEVVAILEEE